MFSTTEVLERQLSKIQQKDFNTYQWVERVPHIYALSSEDDQALPSLILVQNKTPLPKPLYKHKKRKLPMYTFRVEKINVNFNINPIVLKSIVISIAVVFNRGEVVKSRWLLVIRGIVESPLWGWHLHGVRFGVTKLP